VLSASIPIVAVILTYNAVALYEYRRTREVLGKFIGQEMVPETLNLFSRLHLGGRMGDAAAFFCDLRGYSALSQTLSTEKISKLINSYTRTLVKVVKKHGGRPIDFQGDGVFVLFEPIHGKQDYALNAVRAALELQEVFQELRATWEAEGAPRLEIGIGIDTGKLMIGAVGAEEHMKLGAVGEAVNTASRVQSLSQECGHSVLITENTYGRVIESVAVSACGTFPLKGMKHPVEVYGVIGLQGS
jgi:adenylate cyclase